MLGDVHYEEEKLQLESGDLLVFCSDGVMESENQEHEQFGDVHMRDKLLELAHSRPAQVIAQELQRAGVRHGNFDGLAPDDATVLVLKKS